MGTLLGDDTAGGTSNIASSEATDLADPTTFHFNLKIISESTQITSGDAFYSRHTVNFVQVCLGNLYVNIYSEFYSTLCIYHLFGLTRNKFDVILLTNS